jgi:hypothetical protein
MEPVSSALIDVAIAGMFVQGVPSASLKRMFNAAIT